jgi:glycosyltransferase involved in cell wall biosynthesis
LIKVSVIIPIYNKGQHLEECLKSVLSQTLKEKEIICINDGSTDHSLEILKKYSSTYNNIVIIDQENVGVSKSRNKGLQIAKGEFVAFMDADDFYPDNDILECLYRNAKENDVLICGGSFSSYRNGAVKSDFYGRFKDYTFNENRKMNYREYQYGVGFTRFIYNLSFLKKNHLFFPPYVRSEDLSFLVRALVDASEFYAIKKVTYCYRLGHKKVILDLQNTLDFARGILDMLSISKENRLGKLHATTIEILHEELSFSIYKHVGLGHTEFEELLYAINHTIDSSLLQIENKQLKEVFLLEPPEIEGYLQKIREEELNFLQSLRSYKEVIIYGAGKVGVAVAEYVKSINGIEILCFAVTNQTNNPSVINNIPVNTVDEISNDTKKNALVLIATFPYLHKEIQITLENKEFRNVLPIDFKGFQLFGTS